MICNKCKGNKIRSRTNYTHGTKSKSTTTFECKKCGSRDIEVPQKQFGRQRRR